MSELLDDVQKGLEWLPVVLDLLEKLRVIVGDLPTHENGRLMMPKSSALVAAAQLDPAAVGNVLLAAACKADPSLHSAISIARLNAQGADARRIAAALGEPST